MHFCWVGADRQLNSYYPSVKITASADGGVVRIRPPFCSVPEGSTNCPFHNSVRKPFGNEGLSHINCVVRYHFGELLSGK